jgi:uridine phosphorylase
MDEIIAESELVLNDDGSAYHLHILPQDVADTVILVGDPERVEAVSWHFDRIETKKHKREFITHTGFIGNKKFTVISSGIGTDNIDIVMNELDILVNIDLENRRVSKSPRRLRIVRVGTSGSLQKDIPVDSILLSSWGLGLDGLMNFYHFERDETLENNIRQQLSYPFINPYLTRASGSLLNLFDSSVERGITATCCGFYAPQGRKLRKNIVSRNIITNLNKLRVDGIGRVTNFEMETAAIYGLAQVFGFDALSVNAILANRITHEFSRQPQETVERTIRITLDALLKD